MARLAATALWEPAAAVLRVKRKLLDFAAAHRQSWGRIMADHDLLRRLSEAPGAPGHEDVVRAIVAKGLAHCGPLTTDCLGGIQAELPAADDDAPRVLVTAHMDEVAFMVQGINADGGIQVVGLGGWWSHTLLSQRMTLTTRSGQKLLGVFAATPVHHLAQADRDRLIPVERLIFDVGASRRTEVQELGIGLGDILIPAVDYQPLSIPHRFIGKALDNRLGLGCLIESAQCELGRRQNLVSDRSSNDRGKGPNHALFAATVQEEVGTRGAVVTGQRSRPDVALVLECPPADDLPIHDPGGPQGALGQGVQIRLFDPTAIASRRLVDLVLATAEAKKIPYQLTVRRSGGTDAARFQLAHDGVPTIVLGVPARYIHSHNGIFDERDYDAMLALVCALLEKLDRKAVGKLTDFL